MIRRPIQPDDCEIMRNIQTLTSLPPISNFFVNSLSVSRASVADSPLFTDYRLVSQWTILST